MLAGLPPELLEELRESTLALDREAVLEVVERMAEHAPDTAAGLRTLVQNFQMGRIRELLQDGMNIEHPTFNFQHRNEA